MISIHVWSLRGAEDSERLTFLKNSWRSFRATAGILILASGAAFGITVPGGGKISSLSASVARQSWEVISSRK
jgi:hypothetical protein